MLIAAWQPHIRDQTFQLDSYADKAVAPLLPEEPVAYLPLQRAARCLRYTPKKLQIMDESAEAAAPVPWSACGLVTKKKDDDSTSVAGASTAMPDDGASDREDPEESDF